MIPKFTQIDTDQVSKGLKLIGVDEDKTSRPADRLPLLRPEVRKAFEESWERHEEAYRYLGR